MSNTTAQNATPTTTHNQPTADPLAHFKAIPWCARLLSQKSIIHIAIPDRTPLPSTESAMVRETFNTPKTVKACLTYLKYIPPPSKELMQQRGETKANPFLEFAALLDLGTGVNGYAKTAHGGVFGVVLDEVMGSAAALQAKNGAYTATLTVDFKKPLFTPAVVVVTGQVEKVLGKKIFVRGALVDEDGAVVAEAKGLWIMMGRDVGRWTTEGQKVEKEREREKLSKL